MLRHTDVRKAPFRCLGAHHNPCPSPCPTPTRFCTCEAGGSGAGGEGGPLASGVVLPVRELLCTCVCLLTPWEAGEGFDSALQSALCFD